MTHAHAHHDCDHDHSHAPTVTHANERKVLTSFALTFTFMVVETIGGILSGSLALLADAGHMLTDAAALALAYGAFRIGRRAADHLRTFGYLRVEVLAGFVNAATLFIIAVWILYEAWQRLSHPVPIVTGPMMIVAVMGLLVNALVLWIMTRGDTDHVNIQGAMLHVLGDLLGSVGAIAAAIVILLTGWTPIDPILSVLVSGLILRSAWRLLAQSSHILLEGAPDQASGEHVVQSLMENVANLAAVHHVHVWQMTSGRTLATLHVRPNTDAQARNVVQQTEQVLRTQFAIAHATIAIDWSAQDAPRHCSFQPRADHAHAHDRSHHHANA